MNKKIYRLILLVVAVCTMFCACSDDSVEKTPLQAPVISEGSKTVSTLSFSWSPIEGASQYAYELYNGNNELVDSVAGMTTTTNLLVTGLEHNSTYTLKVWAYSPVDGNKTTSPIATFTATTNAPTQLNTLANTEVNADKRGVTVTWPAVENADTYKYSYTMSDGSVVTGSTNTNSVTLNGLATGDYTLTIIASSNDENYSDSEPFSTTFSFVKMKEKLWSVEGQYYSGNLDQYFDAELICYDDGTYTLNKPFGEDGYSFDFVVKDGVILPAETEEGGYYWFYVSNAYYNYAYFGSEYSSFTGDSTQGKLWFNTYLCTMEGSYVGGWSCDNFTWEPKTLTVDDFCGTYDAHVSGYDYFTSDWSYQTVDRTDKVTISKNDDGTINIYNFYDWEDNFTATVDLSAKTITIEPCTWSYYYTFADADDETKAVVATINEDNSITFSNFGCWYNKYSYICKGSECIMKKQ